MGKKAAVFVKALTQKEVAKQHEQLISILWYTLQNLKPEGTTEEHPPSVKICYERFIFKFLENNLHKARLILHLFNASAQFLTSEFDLAQFKSHQDVQLLEESGYQVDLIFNSAMIIEYL